MATVINLSGEGVSNVRTAFEIWDIAVDISGSNCRPASVKANPLAFLRKRGVASLFSKARTFWLIADCVTPNSVAADVKLKCRAALSKERNQAIGGKERLISLNLAISCTYEQGLYFYICKPLGFGRTVITFKKISR